MSDACEFCSEFHPLEQHHIAQGVDRAAAGDNPACSIWICQDCHTWIQGVRDCRPIGLAIIKIRRPDDYDLEEFYRVTNRRFPDAASVKKWVKRLRVGVLLQRGE